jgi:hypothetical protein
MFFRQALETFVRTRIAQRLATLGGEQPEMPELASELLGLSAGGNSVGRLRGPNLCKIRDQFSANRRNCSQQQGPAQTSFYII